MYNSNPLFSSSAAAVRIGYEEHMPGQVRIIIIGIVHGWSVVKRLI